MRCQAHGAGGNFCAIAFRRFSCLKGCRAVWGLWRLCGRCSSEKDSSVRGLFFIVECICHISCFSFLLIDIFDYLRGKLCET